ncbi:MULTISPECIES: helix-turn-helix domain-containing protein [Streptomyces]|uniref:helix-turn-helix domain-containing protein n=1 Tax=Streptomyces TaxID=1883 RepID=UPI0022495A85|nr:helix-turn-helix transcriptional regulator [Streptomyces sp. JHD 1]MCX2971068.1 helix-turn-helix transcriptional regulator [Streptomyces sp. JHD 1]
MDDDGLLDDGLEDDSGALMRAVGRQVKLWREDAGMTQAELGTALGYSEEMISAVERGRRLPKPNLLERADEVLGAGGKIKAMVKEVAEARYPRKVRSLARVEGEAVEINAYENHNLHGLLQTETHARALFRMRRPFLGDEVVERGVAGRIARQSILGQPGAPVFGFVQEEVTLRRPLGEREAHREQLKRLLEIGELRNVELQVMPTNRTDHAGMGGPLQLLKLRNGRTLGHVEVHGYARSIPDAREVQRLEIQYGIIRAQALTPRESLEFIEKLLGET